MSRRAPSPRRPLAVALVLLLVASPLVVARAALADEPPPAGGSGPGAGSGAGSTISQVNKAFGLLFMIAKLADLCRGVDWPEQSSPPPPRWGWHPDPLPVAAPVVLAATAGGGCELPYNAPVDR